MRSRDCSEASVCCADLYVSKSNPKWLRIVDLNGMEYGEVSE
jgi:hypothetical protein